MTDHSKLGWRRASQLVPFIRRREKQHNRRDYASIKSGPVCLVFRLAAYFKAPRVKPFTIWRWAMATNMTAGMVAKTAAAPISP